jgi:hypothetical protein
MEYLFWSLEITITTIFMGACIFMCNQGLKGTKSSIGKQAYKVARIIFILTWIIVCFISVSALIKL